MSTIQEKNVAYNKKPTRVFMNATIVQSCGHLNHESMKRIRHALIAALYDAAAKEGMTSTWSMDMSTKTPKDFDALLARRGMVLEEPPSADAVDPQVASHPGPSTREKGN